MGINQKIKICHLISGDLWAGAEVQMYTVVLALSHCPEFELSAILLNDGLLAEKLRAAGIVTTVYDERKMGFFQIKSNINQLLTKNPAAIMHSHRYKENILAATAKKRGKVKYLVQTVHGIGEPFHGLKSAKSRFRSILNTYYTRKYFDTIISVSDNIRGQLAEFLPSSKIITIHNAVDPANLHVSKSPRLIRAELGINDEHQLIGSVGRMVPVKGYDLFLKMAAMISHTNPMARFLLVGDGPLKSELENSAREMGLGGEIVFAGFRSDVTDLINSLDIFVMTSIHEGIPMALLEAMALEKAVVSTAVGGIVEVISNGKSGLLVEPGSCTALAQACLRILDDDALKVRLGAEAAQRIDDEFSIGTLTEKVSAEYRGLAGLE